MKNDNYDGCNEVFFKGLIGLLTIAAGVTMYSLFITPPRDTQTKAVRQEVRSEAKKPQFEDYGLRGSYKSPDLNKPVNTNKNFNVDTNKRVDPITSKVVNVSTRVSAGLDKNIDSFQPIDGSTLMGDSIDLRKGLKVIVSSRVEQGWSGEYLTERMKNIPVGSTGEVVDVYQETATVKFPQYKFEWSERLPNMRKKSFQERAPVAGYKLTELDIINAGNRINIDPNLVDRINSRKAGTSDQGTSVARSQTNRLEGIIRDVVPYSFLVKYNGTNPSSIGNISVILFSVVDNKNGDYVSIVCPEGQCIMKGRKAEITYVSAREEKVSGRDVMAIKKSGKSLFEDICPPASAKGIMLNIKYSEGVLK